MTQTPAEKAVFKLLRYFYPAESFLHPALVDDVKAIIQAAIDESLPKWQPMDIQYHFDTYKARVAVLENCLEHYAHDDNWFHGKDGGCWLGPLKDGEQANDYAAEILVLTPEQCLERIAKHGEEG